MWTDSCQLSWKFHYGLECLKGSGLPDLEIPEDIEHDIKYLLGRIQEYGK